jgi:hypothetical protein
MLEIGRVLEIELLVLRWAGPERQLMSGSCGWSIDRAWPERAHSYHVLIKFSRAGGLFQLNPLAKIAKSGRPQWIIIVTNTDKVFRCCIHGS